jgi:hypothetical protein
MSATPTAMYSQNSTQTGSTLAGAFPQVSGYAQNLDLFQIVSKKGLGVMASVDYLGNVASGLTVTQVGVVGAVTTYTGTFANGGTNAFVGRYINVKGFTTAGNNGKFIVTGSTTTTITVATTTQSNETHAATLVPYTAGTRIGRFTSDFSPADTYTLAQLVANTFTNPSNLDIFQAVNVGGNVHYYLDYLGVAHGS